MPPDLQNAVNQIVEHLPPFYRDPAFWISQIIGVFGLYFAIQAWREAKQAKTAAKEAGRVVKAQSIAIELSEINQKLDQVQPGIRFAEARSLLTDCSRRVHRATSPFLKEPALTESIAAAKQAVETAQNSLKTVRPTDAAKETEAPDAVYYGIEADCSVISSCVADLIGLFEEQNFGDRK
jgi:hypothetical protein